MATELQRFEPLYQSIGSIKRPISRPLTQAIIGLNKRIVSDARSGPEFGSIPPGTEMTQTLNREEVMFRMMTRLAEGRAYTAPELASLVDNYPIGIFVKSNKEEIQIDGILEKAHPDDVKGTMSYVLPRFVNSRHFKNLNNAEVHLTDDPDSFFADGTEKFIPNNRSRVYSLRVDEQGKSHITFLLRHNIKENYTDAFEVMSFMGFIETARAYGKKYKDRNAGYMVAGLAEGEGMSVSKGAVLKKPWEGVPALPRRIADGQFEQAFEAPKVMQDVVDKIDVEMKVHNIESPKHVLFGNDFSVELLIGTGVILPAEFEYIKANAIREGKESKLVAEQELAGLKKPDDKEIMRQFSALQYLNRYAGNDSRMLQLKLRLEGAVGTVRKRIIQPTHTALGSYVDIIDFSNLGDNIINGVNGEGGIDNNEIREIVQQLKEKKFKYYSLPYPLGDSMHGIVRAFKNKFDITNFGFFGKVGAVPIKGSTVARGRVVMPEQTSVVSVQRDQKEIDPLQGIRDYPNLLHPEDVVIISHADPHKAVVSVNGLTLQSLQDLPRLKKLIREKYASVNYADLLLDMEADYFNDICLELGIVPASIYYVSDLTLEKTGDPYLQTSGGHDHTIVNALGAEGTLASVVSPFTILNKWLQ